MLRGNRRQPADPGRAAHVSTGPAPVLAVAGLAKAFGGVHAVRDVSFDLEAGRALGLVGPNGSGKTTIINVISGVYRPGGGRVTLHGRPVTGFPSYRLCRLGLNRTFQIPRPLRELSVADNLSVVRQPDHRLFNADPLEFVGLAHRAGQRASSLTSSDLKLLDLARALAAGPDVLLVDELGAGLGEMELHHVARLLRELKKAGLALLVVEHLMGFLEQVVESVLVLNAGAPIFSGTLRAAVADQRVVDVFLGE